MIGYDYQFFFPNGEAFEMDEFYSAERFEKTKEHTNSRAKDIVNKKKPDLINQFAKQLFAL